MWYDFWFARYYFIEIDCVVSRAKKQKKLVSFCREHQLMTFNIRVGRGAKDSPKNQTL